MVGELQLRYCAEAGGLSAAALRVQDYRYREWVREM